MKFWSEQICWKTSSRICVLRQYITGSSFKKRWLTSFTQTFPKNFSRQKVIIHVVQFALIAISFCLKRQVIKNDEMQSWWEMTGKAKSSKDQIVKSYLRPFVASLFFAAFHSWPKIVLLPLMKYSLTITETFLFSRHFNAERKPCIS